MNRIRSGLAGTLSLLLLFSVSCASPKPPMVAPVWTTVPPIVLEALCSKLKDEGVPSATSIAVVKMTQPLASGRAVAALANLSFKKKKGSAHAADDVSATMSRMPVSIPNGGGCAYHPIDALDRERDADMMVVQVSSPFVNPYAPNEAGVIAQYSLGGQASQWYWIPFGKRGDEWGVGLAMPLAMPSD